MKFKQMILRKIIKIVATRCQKLRRKCNKIDFGWGSSRPPSWKKVDLLEKRKGTGTEGERYRKARDERGRRGGAGTGLATPCVSSIFS